MNTPVMDKIAKLLELSKSPNEHEAMSAMAKAQKLMLEHNIKAEEIKQKEKRGYQFGRNRVKIAPGKSLANWKRNLLGVIAQHNNCKFYFYRGSGDVLLLGEDHDVSFVLMIYYNMSDVAEKLADVAYAMSNSREHGKTWKNSYYHGFVDRVGERLSTEHQLQNTALMVRKTDALEIYARENVNSKRVNTGVSNYSYDAYSAGYRDGERVKTR